MFFAAFLALLCKYFYFVKSEESSRPNLIAGHCLQIRKAIFSSIALHLMCSLSPNLSMFFLPFQCLSEVQLKMIIRRSYIPKHYIQLIFFFCEHPVTVRKRTGKIECFWLGYSTFKISEQNFVSILYECFDMYISN